MSLSISSSSVFFSRLFHHIIHIHLRSHINLDVALRHLHWTRLLWRDWWSEYLICQWWDSRTCSEVSTEWWRSSHPGRNHGQWEFYVRSLSEWRWPHVERYQRGIYARWDYFRYPRYAEQCNRCRYPGCVKNLIFFALFWVLRPALFSWVFVIFSYLTFQLIKW